MGIYIPDMKKPKDCNDCPFQMIDGDFERNEWLTIESCLIKDDEADDCPLIEICDIEYQAYKEVRTMLLQKIEERILYGERRNDD